MGMAESDKQNKPFSEHRHLHIVMYETKTHKKHNSDIKKETLIKFQHTFYWISEIHYQVLLRTFHKSFVNNNDYYITK